MTDFILSILIIVPSVIISSTIHEYAHAWSAYKMGDLTAKINGRLSLNPITHIDPIGLLVMIITGGRIGWSKPVPINERNFDINPILGTAISAIAGPVSNLVLAFITASFYRLFITLGIFTSGSFISFTLIVFIMINLSLAVFNLLPLPPLDGSRILRVILPYQLRRQWEQIEYSMPYLFIIVLVVFGEPIRVLLSTIIDWLLSILIGL